MRADQRRQSRNQRIGHDSPLSRSGRSPLLFGGLWLQLLTQEMLTKEFPQCAEREVSVIIGAAFASGILATGAVPGAKYYYAPASAEIMAQTNQIEAICRQHKTPLPAAALQFLLAHPLVSAIIAGVLTPEHVQANVAMLQQPIPTLLWAELKAERLMLADVPTP
ncbi:MAG: aldo/keto reductase [Chloroflexota bacterium]